MKIGRTQKVFAAVALIPAALFILRPAAAQVLYGTLVGEVTEQSGAVVPCVTIVITNTETGLTRESRTDEAGRYTFGNVLPGAYDLKVSAPGFKTFGQTGIAVTVNNVSRVDFKLE